MKCCEYGPMGPELCIFFGFKGILSAIPMNFAKTIENPSNLVYHLQLRPSVIKLFMDLIYECS